MPDLPQLNQPMDLSGTTLLLNLCIGTVLSGVLAWHFVRFGHTMSNRAAFARILPFIALTTVLVISVVKSSLALSLGLVGALSIVRFRTPIKEPEELAYIFLAIAIGLGLGANQRWPVIITASFILVITAARRLLQKRPKNPNLYVNVECLVNGDGCDRFERLTELVSSSVTCTDVRRVDLMPERLQATYQIHCRDEQQLFHLMHCLKKSEPQAQISFVDHSSPPGG